MFSSDKKVHLLIALHIKKNCLRKLILIFFGYFIGQFCDLCLRTVGFKGALPFSNRHQLLEQHLWGIHEN